MNLYIYGSGGIGCEVIDIVERLRRSSAGLPWQNVCFVDDFREQSHWYGTKVVRYADMLADPAACQCVIALGEPRARQTIYQKLHADQVQLASIIDPSATISGTARLGQGCIVWPHSFISSNTQIADNVMVEISTVIGHDIAIGPHAVISSGSVIGGGAHIGAMTFIGLNCAVKEKVRIGAQCIIGMGSSVFSDIDDAYIALGNPARVARKNEAFTVFK